MCTAVSGRNVNKATPGLRSSCVFVYNSSRVSVVLFMGVSVNVCDIFNSLNFELSSIEFFYNQPPPPSSETSENVYIQTNGQN